MSLTRSIAKNTAYLTIGKIISTVLGVITIALLLRYLSPDDYGRYTTAIAFVLLLGTVTDFGLNLTTTQDISLPNTDTAKTLSSVFTFRLLANLALLGLLPFILNWFPYEPLVKQAILILTVLFFSATLFQVLASYFQSTLEAGKVAIADLAGKVVLLALTAAAVVWRFSFNEIMLTISLASLVQLWALIRFLDKKIALRFSFDWPTWRRIMAKTWPIAVSVVLTTIYFKGDTLILSLTRPYEDVGIYGAAYKILEVLISLPILFMGLVLPPLARSFSEGDKAKFGRLLQKAWDGLCLFTLPMVAGTIILAKPIIALIAGPGYEPASGVLQILIVATGIIFLGSLFTHAVVAVNEQKPMIVYYLIAAIVAVALYIKFIPIYSYYAAAITTVIAELLISLAAFYKVRKKAVFKLSLASFGKTLTASIFMAATIYYLPAWPLVLLIPAGAAVYALVAWFIKAWPHSIHS